MREAIARVVRDARATRPCDPEELRARALLEAAARTESSSRDRPRR